MVEALVAIAILLMAVLGPLSLLSKALMDNRYLRNEIVANYLAQEGLEMMIYLRDIGDDALDMDNITIDKKFCVDAVEGTIEEISSCSFLRYDDGQYTYGADNPDSYESIFNREILVEPVVNNNDEAKEVAVTSTVRWNNQGLSGERLKSYKTYIFIYEN